MGQQRSPFRPDSPVLWMDPQPPSHALGVRYLLWPAWSHVVIAPRPAPRRRGPLNIIDEAILRLLAAGLRSEQELERTLHLDRSLVAYVRADLVQRDLCDGRGAPTPRGLRALRDRNERDDELCHGRVFRDPGTGAFAGRFVERPGYAEIDWYGRTPWVVLGPEGSADRVQVLQVEPQQVRVPRPPRPKEILREIETHRRALAGGDARVRTADLPSERLERVEVVRAPEPVWLVVPVYGTRIEDDGAPWHACDPFGIGSSPPLRRAIERRAASDDQLGGQLTNLLAGLTEEGATRRVAAAKRARRELGTRFGTQLQEVPGLQGSLVDMQVAVADGDHGPRAAADARGHVRRVLAEVLRLTLGEPGPDVDVDLVHDREHDGALIAAQAELLGFEPLPHGLRGVTAANVRAALEGSSGSLRPLFVANVLAAALDPAHPLRALAQRRPDFPARLDTLADVSEAIDEAWDPLAERAELQRRAREALDAVEWMLATRAARALEEV